MTRTLSASGEAPAAAAALRGQSPSPSPRSASTSLQAAAAVNAGLQQEDSRRSSVGFYRFEGIPANRNNRSLLKLGQPESTIIAYWQTTIDGFNESANE
jgi:hypothetical protein